MPSAGGAEVGDNGGQGEDLTARAWLARAQIRVECSGWLGVRGRERPSESAAFDFDSGQRAVALDQAAAIGRDHRLNAVAGLQFH
jgi:hypothetical protein